MSPALFGDRVFVAAATTVFLLMVVNLATPVFVPVLVVSVGGVSPGQGALVMIAGGVAVAVLAPPAGRVTDRAGGRAVVLAGPAVVAVSLAFLPTYAGASPVLAAVGVLGLGSGFVFAMTALTTTAASAVPSDQVGVGPGVSKARSSSARAPDRPSPGCCWKRAGRAALPPSTPCTARRRRRSRTSSWC